jgi:hypothetical protein
MLVSANMPRVLRMGATAFAAALAVAFSASSLTAPTAQAAEAKGQARSSTSGVGAMDWAPTLTPFDPFEEKVHRNLNGTQRSSLLNNCWPGYLCVAAGEGDGQHTVYELYWCGERSLSNFIDAGAAANNQSGGAVAVLRKLDRSVYQKIPADPIKIVPVDWRPVWYLDPC